MNLVKFFAAAFLLVFAWGGTASAGDFDVDPRQLPEMTGKVRAMSYVGYDIKTLVEKVGEGEFTDAPGGRSGIEMMEFWHDRLGTVMFEFKLGTLSKLTIEFYNKTYSSEFEALDEVGLSDEAFLAGERTSTSASWAPMGEHAIEEVVVTKRRDSDEYTFIEVMYAN